MICRLDEESAARGRPEQPLPSGSACPEGLGSVALRAPIPRAPIRLAPPAMWNDLSVLGPPEADVG